MKWHNANIDEPPSSNQLVLISVKGIYYVALYDLDNNLYRLREQLDSFFNPETDLIYWTEFTSHVDI